MQKINKVKFFFKKEDVVKELANQVIRMFENNHFEIVNKGFDLGVAIGGDGTFLHMVRNTNFNSNVLYTGVNVGTLGFTQEVKMKDIKKFIDCIKNVKYSLEKVEIGEIEIVTSNYTKNIFFLNEVVIRDKDLNTVKFDVMIDDCLMEKYTGDGLLIATSFGSTAHNLSLGGSIICSEIPSLQVTPIAPINNEKYHTLTNSVVVSQDRMICLIPNEKFEKILFTIDGENMIFSNVLKINLVIRKKTINILRKKDYNYIKKINDKLL